MSNFYCHNNDYYRPAKTNDFRWFLYVYNARKIEDLIMQLDVKICILIGILSIIESFILCQDKVINIFLLQSPKHIQPPEKRILRQLSREILWKQFRKLIAYLSRSCRIRIPPGRPAFHKYADFAQYINIFQRQIFIIDENI